MRLPHRLAAPAVCALFLLLPAAASAAPIDEELWTKCDKADAAIQCSVPRGIAANPENGHVFVADSGGRRVVELNARGELLKAWGWDVVVDGGTGFEVCVPASGDVCQKGSIGSGAGQFGSAGTQGVALDSAGSVYVVDRGEPVSNQLV